jgi:F-type H+-transporting ATPase subunit epsilon
MATAKQLQLILVTPEKTLLDEPVQALRFPLYDGQIGILPGRAPMVGRLGYGELNITSSASTRSYYIDGGFVQVKGPVVSILTDRSMTADEIDSDEAEQQLQKAVAQVATNDVEFSAKARDQERARRMISMARNARS